MTTKPHLLTQLRDEFNRWEALLAGLTEDTLTARELPAGLSIKDIVGHLRAWQQISIARLEAAQANREPVYAGWPAGDPDADENLEKINAWIHATYRDQPWPDVHRAWRDGFLRLIELSEALPEKDLIEKGVYAWLGDYALAAVLEGTYEHHREHYEPLPDWLRTRGAIGNNEASGRQGHTS